MMEKIKELIQKYLEEAISIRRTIHENPELSMEEADTTALVKTKLEEYGLAFADVSFPSGTAAILEGKRTGKTLLLRADMDALPMEERSGLPFASKNPGICHSCGHDIHTAALLLCARVLSQMTEELEGRIIFLFQPGEERLSGAKMVIQSGLFEKYQPDMVIGLHCWPELPAGSVGIRRGPFMASSDSVKISIKGRGGHGAHPHKSIDPITAAAYVLTELQTIISRSVAPLDSAVLTMGKFQAGTASNIIPDEAVMEGTVRTVRNETRAFMEQKIKMVAECGAKAMGAECQVEYTKGVPAVICDETAVDLLEQAAFQELGHENTAVLETPSMGSEDFARYLELAPGAMFRIGTANENPASRLPLHNSGILFDERAIAAGAAVMSRAAVEFLKREPGILEENPRS